LGKRRGVAEKETQYSPHNAAVEVTVVLLLSTKRVNLQHFSMPRV
jgi:hypothetical protein